MKSPDQLVFRTTSDAITNQDARFVCIDRNRPRVTDWIWQPFVASMTAAKAIDAFGLSHDRFDRNGIIVELPQRVRAEKPIQLLVVDLNRVVERRATKSISPFSRRRVEIRPAVGDNVEAIQKQLETENVVVAVTTAITEPNGAAIDNHVREPRPENVKPSIGKRSGSCQ